MPPPSTSLAPVSVYNGSLGPREAEGFAGVTHSKVWARRRAGLGGVEGVLMGHENSCPLWDCGGPQISERRKLPLRGGQSLASLSIWVVEGFQSTSLPPSPACCGSFSCSQTGLCHLAVSPGLDWELPPSQVCLWAWRCQVPTADGASRWGRAGCNLALTALKELISTLSLLTPVAKG